MKKVLLIIAFIFLVLLFAVSGNNSSTRSSYNGYSSVYNNNETYRRNVDSVAETYGMSSQDVDRSITGGH